MPAGVIAQECHFGRPRLFQRLLEDLPLGLGNDLVVLCVNEKKRRSIVRRIADRGSHSGPFLECRLVAPEETFIVKKGPLPAQEIRRNRRGADDLQETRFFDPGAVALKPGT